VVAGVLIHLTLELGYSSCRKGHDADIDACQLKNDSVMMIMMVVMLLLCSTDWLNVYLLLI
jgi:hypothetical protein